MCDCIKQMNEKLATLNTKLSSGFLLVRKADGTQSMEISLVISTEKIDKKKRIGPAAAIAGFCPFCGTQYQH